MYPEAVVKGYFGLHAYAVGVHIWVANARRRLRSIATRHAGLPHAEGTVDSPDQAVAGDITRLWLRNLTSRARVVGDRAGVVVSLASHGHRAATAWLAVESIARGDVLPGRIVLHLERQDPVGSQLRRLRRRGLEIVRVDPGLGPHAKLHPVVVGPRRRGEPVVLADDDMVYPPTWLATLLAAAARHPDAIVAHRAHRIPVADDGAFAAYATWPPRTTDEPSFATFGTTVSGQLVPASVLDALAARGDAFRELAPKADDVWLHATAVREGVRVAQVACASANFPFVPGSQRTALNATNVFQGGNDRQIAACYGTLERSRVAEDAARETRGSAAG